MGCPCRSAAPAGPGTHPGRVGVRVRQPGGEAGAPLVGVRCQPASATRSSAAQTASAPAGRCGPAPGSHRASPPHRAPPCRGGRRPPIPAACRGASAGGLSRVLARPGLPAPSPRPAADRRSVRCGGSPQHPGHVADARGRCRGPSRRPWTGYRRRAAGMPTSISAIRQPAVPARSSSSSGYPKASVDHAEPEQRAARCATRTGAMSCTGTPRRRSNLASNALPARACHGQAPPVLARYPPADHQIPRPCRRGSRCHQGGQLRRCRGSRRSPSRADPRRRSRTPDRYARRRRNRVAARPRPARPARVATVAEPSRASRCRPQSRGTRRAAPRARPQARPPRRGTGARSRDSPRTQRSSDPAGDPAGEPRLPFGDVRPGVAEPGRRAQRVGRERADSAGKLTYVPENPIPGNGFGRIGDHVAYIAQPGRPRDPRRGSASRRAIAARQLGDGVRLSGADVDRPRTRARAARRQREGVRRGDVADVDEVAPLSAVLENGRRLAAVERGGRSLRRRRRACCAASGGRRRCGSGARRRPPAVGPTRRQGAPGRAWWRRTRCGGRRGGLLRSLGLERPAFGASRLVPPWSRSARSGARVGRGRACARSGPRRRPPSSWRGRGGVLRVGGWRRGGRGRVVVVRTSPGVSSGRRRGPTIAAWWHTASTPGSTRATASIRGNPGPGRPCGSSPVGRGGVAVFRQRAPRVGMRRTRRVRRVRRSVRRSATCEPDEAGPAGDQDAHGRTLARGSAEDPTRSAPVSHT